MVRTAFLYVLHAVFLLLFLFALPLNAASLRLNDPVIGADGGIEADENRLQQEPIKDQIKVTVIRSIAGETITLEVTLPREADKVNISLHNLLGRSIERKSEQTVPSGESTYQFDTRGLPNGHYFVVVEALGQRITKKVMVSR